LSNVPKDIGCENTICIEAENCQRQVIYTNGTAKKVKKFGGNAQKGCGKYLPKEETQ